MLECRLSQIEAMIRSSISNVSLFLQGFSVSIKPEAVVVVDSKRDYLLVVPTSSVFDFIK